MARKSDFEQRVDKIDSLVERLEAASDPATRATAKELVQSLMDLHGAGFERILTLVHERGDPGAELIERFARDDLVRSLLLLYGLHPDPVETRVLEALEKSRKQLKSHAEHVELVSVDEAGLVRLRLRGNGSNGLSAAATVKLAIEDSIRELAPEVTGVVIVEESENGNRHFSLPIVDAPRRPHAASAAGGP